MTFGLDSPLSWTLDTEVMSREGGLGGQGEEGAQQAAGVRRGFDLVFSSPEPAWCHLSKARTFDCSRAGGLLPPRLPACYLVDLLFWLASPGYGQPASAS